MQGEYRELGYLYSFAFPSLEDCLKGYLCTRGFPVIFIRSPFFSAHNFLQLSNREAALYTLLPQSSPILKGNLIGKIGRTDVVGRVSMAMFLKEKTGFSSWTSYMF